MKMIRSGIAVIACFGLALLLTCQPASADHHGPSGATAAAPGPGADLVAKEDEALVQADNGVGEEVEEDEEEDGSSLVSQDNDVVESRRRWRQRRPRGRTHEHYYAHEQQPAPNWGNQFLPCYSCCRNFFLGRPSTTPDGRRCLPGWCNHSRCNRVRAQLGLSNIG